MLRRRLALLVVFAFCAQLLLPALPASALTPKYNLSRLTAEATAIVLGAVTDLAPHWNAEHDYISSTVTFAVSDYLKGIGENKITLEIPGGEVDGILQETEDAPVFWVGQEAVVFVSGATHSVTGWSQGVYTLVDGLVSRAEMIPVNQFIGQIDTILARQGYVSPEAAPQKGISEGTKESFAAEIADLSKMDNVIELTPDAKLDSAASEPEVRPEGWTCIAYETFEGAFPGSWTVSGAAAPANAYWDDQSYRDYAGNWAGYCADEGTNRVSAPGPYVNNMAAWMKYGPFSLADASDADLWLYHWTKTELNYDYFKIYASINGTNWYGVQMSGDFTNNAGNVGGWLFKDFDLTNVYTLGNLCGQANVWIAFEFVSDYSNTYEGTYLDNIGIWKRVGGAAPGIAAVSPTSASAGTSTTVTINGRSFGATQGAGSVRFWWGGSSTWTTAGITSWSDSKIVCTVPTPASSHSSQGIKVTNNSGQAGYAAFTVTFAYRGAKWAGTPSWAKYYIYENTSDTTGEATALKNAAWTWNNTDYSHHVLKYYGSTTRSAPSNDGYNVLRWGTGTGAIAVCTTYSSGGTISEFDIVFDDAYNWSTASTCPADRMDVWNIGIHEIGHGGIGLKDLYGSADTEKTMYGYGANGETKKRSLHSTDISAIQWIYP